VTIADVIILFEQSMPFAGLLVFSLWLRRDFAQAQRQIDEFIVRLKAIEARLQIDDTGTEAAELFDQKDPEPLPLPLPRPLPTATARYR
jgi:hypothetical protein